MAGAAAMAPLTEGCYTKDYKPPRGFDLGQDKVRSLQKQLMRCYESMGSDTDDHINWSGRLLFCDSDWVKTNMADAIDRLRQGRDAALNLILELINLGELPVPPPEDLDAEVHHILGLPRLQEAARLAEFVAHEWKFPRLAVLKFQEWQTARCNALKAKQKHVALKARMAELEAQLEKATAKAYNIASSTAGQSAARMSAKQASTTGGGLVASAGSRSTGRGFNMGGNYQILKADMGGKCLNSRIPKASNLCTFTFMELKAATRNFSLDNILGEGRFGMVHKGWVNERTLSPTKNGTGMAVVVKKLNPDIIQGYEEWQVEINFLGRIRHPNIVKLLGYCFEDKKILLVSKFMVKGSLEDHLFRSGGTLLSWDNRMRIAIGAARGLAFLHAFEKPIIYSDFQVSNILLDSNYNAKLSDFGLPKLTCIGSNSRITTRVMGTYGYAGPEYSSNAYLYSKSDVYGFGLVMVEMLSGQRALDPNCPKLRLDDWAKPYLADRRSLAQLMDPRFEGQYNCKQAFQVAQLTLKCLAMEPRCRPSMKEVVEKLEQFESTKSYASEAWGGGSSSLRDHHHHGRCTAAHQRSSPCTSGLPHGGGSMVANGHAAKAW